MTFFSNEMHSVYVESERASLKRYVTRVRGFSMRDKMKFAMSFSAENLCGLLTQPSA